MTPERALDEIGSLTAGARIVDELAHGPTSDSFLVAREFDRWVLRIDTAKAARFGLDRGAEAFVLGHVYKEGLGPRLEYLDTESGIQLTRYIPGNAWTPADLARPENVARLGRSLHRLHCLDVAAKPFALGEKVAAYAAAVGTSGAREEADMIHASLDRLTQSDVCLCHNDLVAANIVAGDGLYLIDWEYAAAGDPFFDLATVVQHHRLDEELAQELLRAYAGRVREQDLARLREWCDLYARLLILWQAVVDAIAGD